MEVEGCNVQLCILEAYCALPNASREIPELVRLKVSTPAWKSDFIVPLEGFIARLKKICGPFITFRNRKSENAFQDTIASELALGLKNGTIRLGYYLDQPGAVRFPDGHICFLRGAEILGSCGRPILLSEDLRDMQLAGDGIQDSLLQLPTLFLLASPQVLLVFAYVLLSSIRSLLIDEGLPLQAILYITGKQGVGKTTLAERIAAIYTKKGRPCGIIQAGSTLAASNDLIATLRDQPVIIDDLCLSVSRGTTQERIKLASQLIRQGTGDIPIIKRVGKDTVQLPAEAGLIFTAEFPLENLSDLTRCIIVPLLEQPVIPDQLTPALIGDAIRFFSVWFCDHVRGEIERFQSAPAVDSAMEMDTRISCNYKFLRAAFQSFLRFLCDTTASCGEKILLEKFDKAMADALQYQQGLIDSLKENIPVGNLAFCILEGLKGQAFDLTKRTIKLCKHDGIFWKGDICLRPEALIRFVRTQRGFHDWSPNKITRTLKDYGALVLQEENAATVHLEKGIPRVYRIRLGVLEDMAEQF